MPPYLRECNFAKIRERAEHVSALQASLTEGLKKMAAASVDRFVLLDAQDWMTDAQLNDLWSEIARTARPKARVIFRTAGNETILPGRVDAAILCRWQYEEMASKALCARDRSSIYGGFHLYVLRHLH